MLLVLRLFALCAGVLQIAVAAHVVRRPAGPFRQALAGLLALNGLAALRLAFLGEAPVDRWFYLLDGATGPMLLTCAALALRWPDHDRRDRRGFALLIAGAGWAGLVVLVGGISDPLFEAVIAPGYEWLHTTPALLGLVVAGFALFRAMATARAADAAEAGLVALAFLPTLAENSAWAYDQLRFIVDGSIPVAAGNAGRVAGQALVLASGPVLLAALLWPAGRNRGWRQALAVTMVGGAMGYLAFWNLPASTDEARVFAVYLGTTLSFYVLRPLSVGFAYARERTLWTLYDVACLAVAVVVGKTLGVVVMGTPSDGMTWQDLVTIGPLLLLLPLAAVAPRRWLRVKPQQLDRLSADELLGRFLLDHRRRHGPAASAGKQEIEAATGIAENNVAATIRRLERRLGLGSPAGTFVAEQQVGVRGRKRYRLTEAGAAALLDDKGAAKATPTPTTPMASAAGSTAGSAAGPTEPANSPT